MAHLALYRKYRCRTFSDILGQEHVTRTLSNAVREDRVAHAYLFTGPRGTGKTSTARVLAKALNCEKGPTPDPCGECEACRSINDGSSMDVIEIDAASHSKVDETREVLAGVPLAAARGRKKVYVIDEVHMLSAPAFNALLKTLEEPPEHVVFVLATTEAHKVLPTIVSRTQRFDFRRIPAKVLHDHLVEVARAEGIDVEDAAIDLIVRHADGGARDALSALDQLASGEGTITTADAEAMFGDAEGDAFTELFDAIAVGDVGSVFWSIHTLVSRGADARQLALGALGHARSLLLLKSAPSAEELLDATAEDRGALAAQAERFSGSNLLRIVDLLGHAHADMRNSADHRLLLELALVRAASPETDPNPTGLLARLERLERRLGIDDHSGGPAAAATATRVEAPAKATPASSGSEPKGPAPEPGAAAEAPPGAEKRREPDAGGEAASEPGTERKEGARRTKDGAGPAAGEAAGEEQAPAMGPDDQAAEALEVPGGAPAQTPAEVGLGAVKESWQATLREVSRRSKRVWGLLSPSRPVSFDDGSLVVEVQSEWHRDEMSSAPGNRTSNADILSEALFAALGIRPRLSFQARGSAEGPDGGGGGGETASGSHSDPASSEASPAEATTEMEDPIELVKRGLGAEVVEERTSGG